MISDVSLGLREDDAQPISTGVTEADSHPTGVPVIEAVLATLPASPGVYRMLDAKGDALYVGKARSLKKRVANYTLLNRMPERLRRMVMDTVSMEIVTTHTEAEALLLEANLIKRLKPRYNIVLRDDKSYPWLMLTETHDFPRITKHRGAQAKGGSYWGPFASAWAVNQTVNAMERVFLLRSCADTVFSNRSRPPACCTRSSAAPPPASARSRRTTTPASSARPAPSSPARSRTSSASSPPKWSKPPNASSSSAPPPCATASAASPTSRAAAS